MVKGSEIAEIYIRPRYTKAEAARIVSVSENTFRNWAHGYIYRTTDGERSSPALITLAPTSGDRMMVPFIGLAEAHVLVAFRRSTGVPMQRIRPALLVLQNEMGVEAALANRRLKTDGAEILYDYGQHADAVGESGVAHAIGDLVVLRNGQRVFREVVADYLRTISYEGDWASTLHLRRFENLDVIVDPRVNYGKPTLASHGIRIADIQSRLVAGEATADVAWDFGLDEADVLALA